MLGRRGLAVALLIAAFLLGVGPTTGSAGAAARTALRAAPATTPETPSGRIVVFLVPNLLWSDVARMPTLRALMQRGAVGVVSVRSQGESTGCGTGFLEISAMTRVPDEAGCLVDRDALPGIRARYRHNRYGAQVGLLGDLSRGQLVAADSSSESVVAGSTGRPNYWPTVDAAVHAGARIVVVQNHTFYGNGAPRARTRATVDAVLARTTRTLPPDTTVMVVGSSDDSSGGPALHPMVIAGPGWPHRALTSASTGRAPFVQLFDVGPTLLASLGVTDLPSSVSGRPVQASGHRVASLSSYVDLDRHARRALSVGHPTFTVLSALLLVCLLLVLLGRPEAGWLARLLIAAPLATWLVQLLPWWRWPVAVYVLLVAAIAVVGAFGWRFVPAVTAVVLLVDQLVGAPLQLAAPFGDNPLVAGRFHGMGNIAFGVTMGALLVCAAATRRWKAAAAIAVVAVLIDGAPMLGDDLGGLLALVPAAAVLVVLLAGLRVSRRRAALALAAAVVTVAAAALLDYTRPAAQQTHAGRFVGQIIHGGAWRVVHRKLDAVLGSFANPVVAVLVAAAAVAGVLVLRRRLDPLIAAAVVLGALGSALNDSGIFVGAAVALVVVPTVVLRSLSDNRRL